MTEPSHPIPTYKPRRRQLSPARAALMARLEPVLCLDVSGPALDLAAVFGRHAPVVLDIGIGHGESLTTAAEVDPETDVIGADVHTPGIASTLDRVDRLGLSNVRLVHGDALRFVDRLADGSLTGIRIFFPDPWPKAKHRRRRLVSPSRLDEFARLLAPAGTVHVATDIVDYADASKGLLDEHPDFEGGIVERPPWRPVTRYERKGLDAGRVVTDLIYRRR